MYPIIMVGYPISHQERFENNAQHGFQADLTKTLTLNKLMSISLSTREMSGALAKLATSPFQKGSYSGFVLEVQVCRNLWTAHMLQINPLELQMVSAAWQYWFSLTLRIQSPMQLEGDSSCNKLCKVHDQSPLQNLVLSCKDCTCPAAGCQVVV